MADKTIESIYASAIVIDEAYVTTSGSASEIDITAAIAAGIAGQGATAAGLAILTAATAAAQRTAMGVPATTAVDLKSDTHLMGPVFVTVDSTGAMPAVHWVPQFAGTLIDASIVVNNNAIATGPAIATIAIAGASATTSAPLEAPIAAAVGTAVSANITAGGAFTAGQVIRVTPSGTNTAAAILGVTIGYTRT